MVEHGLEYSDNSINVVDVLFYQLCSKLAFFLLRSQLPYSGFLVFLDLLVLSPSQLFQFVPLFGLFEYLVVDIHRLRKAGKGAMRFILISRM